MAFNYGLVLVEVIVILFILSLIIILINSLLPKEQKIPSNGKSLFITLLLIFGIVYAIGFIIETFDDFIIVGYLNNLILFFAVGISIFFPLYKLFLRKFEKSHSIEEIDLIFKKFKKKNIIIIGVTWSITAIFLSFDVLGLQLVWRPNTPNYDLLYISFFTAFITIFFLIVLTILINRLKPIETQIPKDALRNSLVASGIISFGIWSIQFIIFEMYISRILGITIIEQDLRVLIILIFGIFIVCYFNLLRVKFLPEVTIKSQKKVLNAIATEDNVIKNHLLREEQTGVDTNLNNEEDATYNVESVSYKLYLFLLKKLRKSHSFYEKAQLTNRKSKMFKNAIVGLLWIIPFVVLSINLLPLALNLNLIFEVFLISIQFAFFMVLIDISIFIIFNRFIPFKKRIPKGNLRKIIFYGGIIQLWIWVVPLFFIYFYFFSGFYQITISNITSVIISSIIIFILGIYITKWRSNKKGFDRSLKNVLILNFLWFIINITSGIFLVTFFGYNLLNDILIVAIDIAIGSFIVKKLYKKRTKTSFNLVFSVGLIIFFLGIIIIKNVLTFFLQILSTFHFNVLDIRVHLIIDISVFLIFFVVLSKVKFSPDDFKRELKEGLKILPILEEGQPQGRSIEGKKVILDVKDLTTYFYTEEGVVRAVESVSFKIYEGETLGLVGETGCGKSVTALSVLQVVRPPGKIESGRVMFEHENLLEKSEKEILNYRGNKITMIFQDPLNSLNPVFKIGKQISEVFLQHMENELNIETIKNPGKSIYSIAREWGENLLRELNIPSPERVYDLYPHELSGGMRQRVQIAMALACSPKLLIADEPTTALDVTIQNQILKLMKELKVKFKTAILFITHDLGIISKMCDRVAVMYSGFIVEYGDIYRVFEKPSHPYTKGLIASIPVIGKKKEELKVIPGLVPNLIYPPSGCRFHPRCQYCFEPCSSKVPKSIEVEPEYFVACHLYDPEYKNIAEISIEKVEGGN